MSSELETVLASVDTVSHDRTEEFGQTGRELVDRFFWRLSQLGIGLGAVAFGLLAVYLWQRRKPPRDVHRDTIEPATVRLDTKRPVELVKPRRAA
jgi:hypothetical protein